MDKPNQEKMDATQELKGGRAAELEHLEQAIDRAQGGQPVYVQLADILRRQILSGAYLPGQRLPSEAMLVESYNVSPMTVRRAINLLAAQDVISTSQGRGTFVKEVELGAAAFNLHELKELFADDGSTTVKMIEARFLPADERIAAKLQVRPGARTIFIRRLLSVGEEPAFYHRGYLIYDPTRPVVEAEFQVTDLQGLLRGTASSLIKSGDLYLEATLLDEEEAGVLNLPQPAPGMQLEHIFYDFESRPVSWGWFVCSSLRLRLHTRIGFEKTNETRDERTR